MGISSRKEIPLVDLNAQYRSIKEDIDGAIGRVIERSAFILGNEVAQFEIEFANYIAEGMHCAACASGTDALFLSLKGLGIESGDEVITTSFTFFATVEAIINSGARPVYVDIEEDTLLMNSGLIEERISERTKAIMPVHLYGQMADMKAISKIAQKSGLKVIEDSAQAHGARRQGYSPGELSDASAYSFYPGKNLGAYGDAGAVVTKNSALVKWIKKARNHGRESKYEHNFIGISSRMDGIQAAVLREKLKHLDEWTEHRRRLAELYSNEIEGQAGIERVVEREESKPVYHLYVVQANRRDEIVEMLRNQGIMAGVHYPIPMHAQKPTLSADYLPITERAASRVLSLPLYPELSSISAKKVADALKKTIHA